MVYMFKTKFPKPDDLVMAIIHSHDTNGVKVILPEYNNIEGYITFSEVSRKKRDVKKIITIGNEVVMLVIKTDEEKGYIDLSKRDVKDTEVETYINKMKQHKTLYNLFKYVFFKLKGYQEIEKILEEELYPFLVDTLFEIQEESGLENSDILDSLLIKEKNSTIFDFIDFEKIYWSKIDIKQIFDHYIDTKINIKKESETTNFRMLTYCLNGNQDIQYTLDYKNFEFYPTISEQFNIEITYISASNYSMVLNQKEFGIGNIKNSIGILVEEIKKRATEKNILLG
jgi:translation initiation factor 2 alpha subunit (eIF-2alpha)